MRRVRITHHPLEEGHYYTNYRCGPVELLIDDEGVVELVVKDHTIPFSSAIREALRVLLDSPEVREALKSADEQGEGDE